MLGWLRGNWRVVLLSVMLVVSLAALFVPGATLAEAGDTDEGRTNLQYGIELDGGTRLSAPVVGVTAEGVEGIEFGDDQSTADVERAIADELGGVEVIDVTVRPNTDDPNFETTVEVFVKNVTTQELETAIEAAGYGPVETTRDGVTPATRQEMVETIDRKLSEAGLSGGGAQIANTGDEFFIVVTAPDRDAEELRNLLSERGVVRIVAYYPQDGEYVNETVLTRDQMRRIGAAEFRNQPNSPGSWGVSVTVSDDAAPEFAQRMADAGFGNGATCSGDPTGFSYGSQSAERGERCLLTVLDGEVVWASGVTPGLGQMFVDDSDGVDFVEDPQYFAQTGSEGDGQSLARQLRLNLEAGALPAPLDFEEAQVISVDPALAQRFKGNSLVTGIAAVIAVSMVVYLRYRDRRVAAPMIVTALSEVVILLGFAASIGYTLDLAVIAGFIAVIGTGVDDLVIIANEVLSEGEVRSDRVFRSRFRKAFWVIGAAAATRSSP